MDALPLSITSFTSIRGYPARFYTDRGTQLSKAGSFIDSKEDPANWMSGKLKEVLATKKTMVSYCLSGCLWQKSTAEHRVQALKDAFKLTMPRGSACLDFIEFRMLLVKCTDMINSHPIGVLLAEDDLKPLTPNHLLIGRAS